MDSKYVYFEYNWVGYIVYMLDKVLIFIIFDSYKG